MSHDISLPEGFGALEPYVARWIVATSAERAALRTSSTPEERAEFFAAASPLMGKALDYLDTHSLPNLPAAEKRLMDLMLTLAHIALAVEIQGPDEIKSAPSRDRMRIIRSAADNVLA